MDWTCAVYRRVSCHHYRIWRSMLWGKLHDSIRWLYSSTTVFAISAFLFWLHTSRYRSDTACGFNRWARLHGDSPSERQLETQPIRNWLKRPRLVLLYWFFKWKRMKKSVCSECKAEGKFRSHDLYGKGIYTTLCDACFARHQEERRQAWFGYDFFPLK